MTCVFSVSYVKFLRRTRAAVVIQRNVRMWATRRRYKQQRSAAITIQCVLRAYMARKQYYKVIPNLLNNLEEFRNDISYN